MKHVFAKMKPSETMVDHRYQRELDAKRVESMARSINLNVIGVPVVSKREDGTCAVLDGQHRRSVLLAAGHGDTPILMEIYEGLTLRDEAELFLRLNGGRTSIVSIDKYKARLQAAEPTAIDIQSILKQHGCKITKSVQRGGIKAVNAVESVYHRGNLSGTIAVLHAWLDGHPDAFDGMLIRGVSAFLVACPEADPMHLASRLVATAPTVIIARLKRDAQQVARSHDDVAKVVLTEFYNKRTPRAKRVAWSHGGDQKPAEA